MTNAFMRIVCLYYYIIDDTIYSLFTTSFASSVNYLLFYHDVYFIMYNQRSEICNFVHLKFIFFCENLRACDYKTIDNCKL